MSVVWCAIMVISIIISFVVGTGENIVASISTSGAKAVENSLTLLGMTCFWTGIFNILRNTKLVQCIAKILNPVISKMFCKQELNDTIKENMSLNITCNMLGVGNAATVYGLVTAEEMAKVSKTPNKVSDNLATFIIINTASIQLLPTSMISLLTLYGATNAVGIVVPVWLSSSISLIIGIVVIKILNKVVK